jgi:hypothetical protein
MEAPGSWASSDDPVFRTPYSSHPGDGKIRACPRNAADRVSVRIFARERQTRTPSSAELRKALARFQRYCLWLGGLFFVSCSLGNCTIFIGTCSQRRVSAAITQLHQ